MKMSENYDLFEKLFLDRFDVRLWNSQRSCSIDFIDKAIEEISLAVKNYQVSDSPDFSRPANLCFRRNGFNNDV